MFLSVNLFETGLHTNIHEIQVTVFATFSWSKMWHFPCWTATRESADCDFLAARDSEPHYNFKVHVHGAPREPFIYPTTRTRGCWRFSLYKVSSPGAMSVLQPWRHAGSPQTATKAERAEDASDTADENTHKLIHLHRKNQTKKNKHKHSYRIRPRERKPNINKEVMIYGL